MTNEELALQYQAGDAAAFDALATQNRGVIHRCAWRLWVMLGADMNPLGMAYEDAAQTALLGLYGAAMAYDPAKSYKLLAYLWRQSLLAFRQQYRGHRNDAMKEAISGDEELGEDNDTTLLDLVPDEAAAQAFEDSEGAMFAHEFQAEVLGALAGINARRAEVFRLHHIQGIPQTEIAKRYGITGQRVSKLIQEAMRQLRANDRIQGFMEEYIAERAYMGTGLSAFVEHGGSSQERTVERAEERFDRWQAAYREQQEAQRECVRQAMFAELDEKERQRKEQDRLRHVEFMASYERIMQRIRGQDCAAV